MWVGLAVFVLGALVAWWAGRSLGNAFTPFPEPRSGASLAMGGPYRFVRHPMYLAALLSMLGWSIAFSVVGFAVTTALAILWFFKARHEEALLLERFPEYAGYRRETWF